MKREPKLDKRFAWGDDFAGDAWINTQTGEVSYAAVGHAYRLIEPGSGEPRVMS